MADSKKKNQNKQSIFTKETFGVVMVLFSTLCFICLLTRDAVFSVPGQAINMFLLGCFGYFALLICALLIFVGVLLITDKKTNLSKKRKALIILFFVTVALLCHVITMRDYSALSYGEYLRQSYLLADGGLGTCSGGGIITGLIAYLIPLILTNVGGYIVLSLAIVAEILFFVRDYRLKPKTEKASKRFSFRGSFVKNQNTEIPTSGITVSGEKEYPIEGVFQNEQASSQKLFIVDSGDFAFKTNKDYRQEAKNQGIKYAYNSSTKLFEEKSPATYTKSYDKAMQAKLDYVKTPAKLDINSFSSISTKENETTNSVTISDAISRSNEQIVSPLDVQKKEEKEINENPSISAVSDSAKTHAELFSGYAEVEEVASETPVPVEKAEDIFVINEGRSRTLNVEDIPFTGETIEGEDVGDILEKPERRGLFSENSEDQSVTPSAVTERRARDIFAPSERKEEFSFGSVEEKSEQIKGEPSFSLMDQLEKQKEEERLREEAERKEIEEKKKQVVLPPVHVPYVAPKIDLLFDYEPDEDQPKENHEEKMNIIINTLESFKIKAEPVDWIQGPTVTRYELRMPVGTPVTSVLKYDNDLKMWLSSREGVMIQAPIPGKGLIGVEVANQSRVKVGLKELMKGLENKKHKEDTIYFALGKDVVGNPVEDDLGKGPHYLVAGTTGSGKSVCLNIMITSMIMRYSPEDVRFILVDPKHVDYAVYEHLPHLLVDEIIDKPEKVVAALSWLYEESERRFEVFKQAGGYAKIEEYNKYVACDTIPKMPRIVMVIDEVADLMQNFKKEMESKIAAIAQKARAAGVHLILATQYPRGDIISTPIKANLPGRIALRVTSGSASQLMLGQPGAEKLLGYGDMLYRNNFMSEPERYQGGIIELEEIKNIVKDIIANNKAYFDQSLTECLAQVDKPQDEPTTFVESSTGIDNAENSDLFVQALALAIENGTISISYLQRHFQIGYARAGGLIDKMERKGYISGNEGSKGRKVYITKEEFLEKFGQNPEGYGV